MSLVTDEILAIETEVNACFDTDAPIDPKKIKRLQELRLLRLKELVQTHEQRLEIMKTKTRAMRDKLIFTTEQMALHAGTLDQLYTEIDKYDIAASHWVISESCVWEESEAANLITGILILANEIC